MKSNVKKNQKVREEKFKFNNYKNLQKGDTYKTNKFCSKCKSNFGSDKLSYPTEAEAISDSLGSLKLHAYSCPFGNGWHLTSNIHFEETIHLHHKFKYSYVDLYINDDVYTVQKNKKNYKLKEFFKSSNTNNLIIATLWSEDRDKNLNLKLHTKLKNFFDNFDKNVYEVEVFSNKKSEFPLFGYGIENTHSTTVEKFLKEQKVYFYHYVTPAGILRFKTT